jgi:hypothetical protein
MYDAWLCKSNMKWTSRATGDWDVVHIDHYCYKCHPFSYIAS